MVETNIIHSRKRYLSPLYLTDKIKMYGFRDSLRILKERIQVHFQKLFQLFGEKVLDFFLVFLSQRTKQDDTLYAYYDLRTSALDFGVVVFLSIAEEERICLGVKNLCLVVVPETDNDLQKRSNNRLATKENRSERSIQKEWEWRLRNIIMPSISSLGPHCQIKVFSSRKEAYYFEKFFVKFIFPIKYSMSNPTSVNINYKNTTLSYLIKAFQIKTPNIKSTPSAMKYVSEWINLNAKGRKVITITLREYQRAPNRNSSLKDWASFVRSLDRKIFFPIILRDTEKDFQLLPKELEGVKIFHQPVWNIELRSALYQLSYLNLLKDNGVGVFCILNPRVNYLFFHSMIGSSIEYWNSQGLLTGKSYPWSGRCQKVIWERDRYEVIKREFELMCRKIEKYGSNNNQIKKSNYVYEKN